MTEASVLSLSGSSGGRSLYLSIPLCRILTADELRAIISHELGHFKGDDTEFSKKFYPIYKGAQNAIDAMLAHVSGGSAQIAILPAVAVLSHFLESFSEAENRIGRERELAADAVAAEAVGKKAIASALVKLHAFETAWALAAEAFAGSREASSDNIVDSFERLVVQKRVPEALKGLDEETISHPTDTHPPLSARLDALGATLESIRNEALAEPTVRASTLIDGGAELEASLSRTLREKLDSQIDAPSFFTFTD